MKEEKGFYTTALVALLTVSAFFLADTVDAMIGRSLETATGLAGASGSAAPKWEPRRELGSYTSVLERGLFGDGTVPSQGPAEVEAASYTLIGTMEGNAVAGAVIEDKTGQAFYRVNEQLPDGSTLITVLHHKIIIRKPSGSTVEIEVPDDAKIVTGSKSGGEGVKQLSEGKWVVDQQEVLASTENMSQILTQARALPYQEGGKTVGFRISEIVPGSIYEKIGLQNGDVIQKVNSQDVDDPAKFFQLYQGLRTERFISIDLIRGGVRQSLNYEIR